MKYVLSLCAARLGADDFRDTTNKRQILRYELSQLSPLLGIFWAVILFDRIVDVFVCYEEFLFLFLLPIIASSEMCSHAFVCNLPSGDVKLLLGTISSLFRLPASAGGGGDSGS